MSALDCSTNGKDRDLCHIGKIIAQNNHYEHLSESEAIYRHIVDKYNWLPSQVRELTREDILLLLDGYNKIEVMP